MILDRLILWKNIWFIVIFNVQNKNLITIGILMNYTIQITGVVAFTKNGLPPHNWNYQHTCHDITAMLSREKLNKACRQICTEQSNISHAKKICCTVLISRTIVMINLFFNVYSHLHLYILASFWPYSILIFISPLTQKGGVMHIMHQYKAIGDLGNGL